MSVPALLDALRAWVPRRPDILAAALVGSYARSAATDESDVDLMLLTDASAAYAVDTEWAAGFGEVRTAQVETWGSLTTLRVWYRNDLEVEFNFAPATWAAVPVDAGTARVVADGMQILWDPHDLLQAVQQAVSAVGHEPDQ